MPRRAESKSDISISPLNDHEKVKISQILFLVSSLRAEFSSLGSDEREYLEGRIAQLNGEISQIIGPHVAAAYAKGPINEVYVSANGIVASAVAATRSISSGHQMEIVFGTGIDSLRQVISSVVKNPPRQDNYSYTGYEEGHVSEETLFQRYLFELGYPTDPQRHLNAKDERNVRKQVETEICRAKQEARCRDRFQESLLAREERRTIRWENRKSAGFLGLGTKYETGKYVWDGSEFGKDYLWNFLREQCLAGSTLVINGSARQVTRYNIEEIYYEIIS
jgi:hypothetical protein